MDIIDLKITHVKFVTILVAHVQMNPLNVLFVLVSELEHQHVSVQVDIMKTPTEFVLLVMLNVAIVKITLIPVPDVLKEELEKSQTVLVMMEHTQPLPENVLNVDIDVPLVDSVPMIVLNVLPKLELELQHVTVLMDTTKLMHMILNVSFVTLKSVLLVNPPKPIVPNVPPKEPKEPSQTVHVPTEHTKTPMETVKLVTILVEHVQDPLIIVYLAHLLKDLMLLIVSVQLDSMMMVLILCVRLVHHNVQNVLTLMNVHFVPQKEP